MHVPLEIIRLILDFYEPGSTIEQLFALRLVSSTFNAEIIARIFLGKRIDAIFHENFWTSYHYSGPMWHYPIKAVPQDAYHLRRMQAPFWCNFPRTLKPTYYYYRLKRRGCENDRFWQLFQPIFEFALATRGLKEDVRDDCVEADQALRALCEGINIFGDGKEERLLFDAENFLQPSQYAAKRTDVAGIIHSFHLALLFRAMEKRDHQDIRKALTRGALLDKPSTCFGREPLLHAVRNNEAATVSILLTYGEYKDPRNRPRQLVSAMRLAAQLRNTQMMILLLDHPLGIRQASDQITLGEENSHKDYTRPVHSKWEVAEVDEELDRLGEISLLQQALSAALGEALKLSDVDFFDCIIRLYPDSPKYMLEKALLRAIKASNLAIVTHILNSPMGSAIDLNAAKHSTPTLLHIVITHTRHKTSRAEMASLLLERGVDPNRKSLMLGCYGVDRYQHPLRILDNANGQRLDLFKVLVEGGARIEECEMAPAKHLTRKRPLLEEFGQVDWVKAALSEATANKREMESRHKCGLI